MPYTKESTVVPQVATAHLTADVLIVGGGPVGLTLALDLAGRGITTIVVETRDFNELPSVKCNHVSARSMEQFRRLGLAGILRQAGLPDDYPNDVVLRTAVTGTELSRIPIPCRADRFTEKESPDAWWPTSEPPHRINQIYLEPIIREHASAQSYITLLHRNEYHDFSQDDSGITARVRGLDDGHEQLVRAQYIVGCDGGRSQIRRQIGAKLEGDAVIQRVQSTCLRAPDLAAMVKGPPALYCYVMNPRRCGAVIAIDGKETWVVHNHLNPDEPDFDSVDRDQSIRNILGVGPDFKYELISKEDWVGRRLVADRMRDRRAFIAGDAAHLWVPYAGYGMNAGIADAVNLAWLLAARLQGWGAPSILDAYEAERQPVTDQVSHFAMEHAKKVIAARRAVPTNIEHPDPEGEAVRQEVGREFYDVNVAQFCCAGLNFGYYYTESPIIVSDSETAPPYSMGNFEASTVPGCRTPHFWLADGSSLYDALGAAYTLLRLRQHPDPEPLLVAAQAAGIPITVLDLTGENVPDVYQHALVLCRTDQHIVWRGNGIPDSPAELLEQLRGVHQAVADSQRLCING